MRPATIKLHVLYAPSVTVTPVKPGMVEEGQEVIFASFVTFFNLSICQFVVLSFCQLKATFYARYIFLSILFVLILIVNPATFKGHEVNLITIDLMGFELSYFVKDQT